MRLERMLINQIILVSLSTLFLMTSLTVAVADECGNMTKQFRLLQNWQRGKSITKTMGLYVDGLVGIGTDRPYDWGVGTGIRFNY